MTLLNPTPEELQLAHVARLADQREREQRWRHRHRRFLRNLTLAGAMLLAITARIAAFGGSIAWPGYLVFLLVGGGIAWLIVQLGWGILRGMLLYGCGAFLAWLGCFSIGWWQWADGGGVGPLLMMMMGWLAWIVIGGVLGMLTDQFDSDHLHC